MDGIFRLDAMIPNEITGSRRNGAAEFNKCETLLWRRIE